MQGGKKNWDPNLSDDNWEEITYCMGIPQGGGRIGKGRGNTANRIKKRSTLKVKGGLTQTLAEVYAP